MTVAQLYRYLDCPALKSFNMESCSGAGLRSLSDYKDYPQPGSTRKEEHLSMHHGEDTPDLGTSSASTLPQVTKVPCALNLEGDPWMLNGMSLLLAWKARCSFAERLLDALLEGASSVKVSANPS